MAKLDELRERLATLNTEAQDIRSHAEGEKRDFTVEETEQLDDIMGSFDRTKSDIERLERLGTQTETLNAPTGRKTQPDAPANLASQDPEAAAAARKSSPRISAQLHGSKNGGFQSLGEFGFHVARYYRNNGQMDPRLDRLAATTYGNETSGTDGGFAVPPDFRSTIMEAVMGEESLLSRCDQITVSGNSFTSPVDMTTPWQSSGGIQAYWGSEAATKTQSKPSLEERNVKLNKLYALVPMTDELLEDASAMDAYLRRKAPEAIAFKASLAILQGSGSGQPLGVLNSPALVSVAKETGQVADTIVGNNILKMYSRMYAPSRSKAVWVINQDIEPQLLKLSVPGTDNTGNAVTGWGGLVYMPANGLSSSPFATLFGRPVIPSQAAETLGDKGDILFVDFSQYLVILKGGPNPKVDISIHLWFDQDVTAFRFVLRLGGMPWWSAPIAARDGSNTYSPLITLDERA